MCPVARASSIQPPASSIRPPASPIQRLSMLNPDRLTVKSSDAINDALSLARREGNPLVHDTHLLRVLLDQDEGIVAPILQKLGVTIPALAEAIDREIARYPKQSAPSPTPSRELCDVR